MTSARSRLADHAAADPEKGKRTRRPGDPTTRRSRAIVLLGIDGAGKTTTATALARALRGYRAPAVVLRNPAGRRWLTRISTRFGWELPLRWTDRFETVVRTVNVLVSESRARLSGGSVVFDRHLVCQLVLRRARGLPRGRFLSWSTHASLKGKTVVVLDVPAEVAYERIRSRGEDLESLDFLRATRAAYLEFAGARGWNVIDATGTTEAIIDAIGRVADR